MIEKQNALDWNKNTFSMSGLALLDAINFT